MVEPNKATTGIEPVFPSYRPRGMSGGTESKRRKRIRSKAEPLGWLYIIGEDFNGASTSYVKIGFCATEAGLARRVAELQTGNPRRLFLRATCRGTLEAERQLHRDFTHRRVLGEWFRWNKEIRVLCESWNEVGRVA